MSSVRRVYFYLVCLITLGIFAGGLGVLLSLLFDITISGPATAGQSNFNQQQLSLGLAMLVIGGPLWFFFWRSISKHVGSDSSEIGSSLRKFFLNLILVVSSLTSVFAGQTVFTWLLSGFSQSPNSSGSLATLIIAFAVWIYHLRISEGEGHPSASGKTLRRWYIYIVSGWGLVILTFGIVQLINTISLFLPFWGNLLTSGSIWSTSVRDNISAIIFGGLLWAFHWFRMAKADSDSTLRQVYIYLLAIIVSSITGLVALTIGLYQTFIAAMGAVADITGTHFQYLGWVIPTIVVTAAVWVYHQSIAKEEAAKFQESVLSSKRIHLYIMSFIGLGTLISGLIVLFGTLLDFIINSLNPAIAVQAGWWQRQLSLSLALLIVALPIWWYYWNQITRLSTSGGIVEWRARSRRIYLYVIVGASIIALAAVLVNIIYQFLSGALGGNFNVNVLQNSKWSIQTLLVSVPLLIYHWQIARHDQHKGAEVFIVPKTVTAIIDNQSLNLIGLLEKKLGASIHILEITGMQSESQHLSDDDLTKAAGEILSSQNQKFMLVIREGKILVLPYQEK
jgi:hypothetical protein